MSTTTIPNVGDLFEYDVIVSKADWQHKNSITMPGHYFVGYTHRRECDPDNTRSCALCYDQWEVRTSVVTEVIPYMDNSIEVRCEDGTRRNVVQPHGDVCY